MDKTQNSLSNYRRSLLQKALRAYQEEWVRTQRELKILNRGKQPAVDMDRTEHQLACLLIPERGRLALLMESDKPLAPTEMWLAIADLHSLCVQAFIVVTPSAPRLTCLANPSPPSPLHRPSLQPGLSTALLGEKLPSTRRSTVTTWGIWPDQ